MNKKSITTRVFFRYFILGIILSLMAAIILTCISCGVWDRPLDGDIGIGFPFACLEGDPSPWGGFSLIPVNILINYFLWFIIVFISYWLIKKFIKKKK